jgi:hypothetical protein
MKVLMDKKIKSCSIFNLKIAIFSIFLISILSFSNTAFAILYAPGATLNPTCLPTDSNCDVQFNFFASGPLSGAGTSTSPLTISQASSILDGYVSSIDWNIFNDKLSTTTASATYTSFAYATSTFVSFQYATNTFATISSLSAYLSTTSAASDYISTSTFTGTLGSYLTSASAALTYLPLSASTSLSYIPLSASTSLSYIPLSASTSLDYVKTESDPIFMAASTSLAYVVTETDPIWMAASSSYLTTASSTATYLTITNASNTYLPLSASTSLAYIPFASSSLYVTGTPWTLVGYITNISGQDLSTANNSTSGFITASALIPYLSTTSASVDYISTSTFTGTLGSYLTSATAATTYLPLSASTSLAYIPYASSSLYYLASNPSSYITASALIPYLSTTSASIDYLSTSTASSTYLKITDASSTYQPIGSYLTSFTETDPIWMAASSSYLTIAAGISTLANYPTLTYASSTYYFATNPSGYVSSTTSSLNNYPTYSYASSTFASTSYIIANYIPYSYASSTYASTTFVTNNFPTYSYASSSYLLYSSSTEVLGKAYFTPVYIAGSITYDANTSCAYEFDGNGNEVLHGYNLVPNNSGGTYITSSPTPKYGSGVYTSTVGNNFDDVNQNCESPINSAGHPWSIQWWQWLPTKGGDSGAKSDAYAFSRGTGSDNGAFRFELLTNQWNPWGSNEYIALGSSALISLGSWNSTNYSGTLVANSWNHISVEYDGDKYRIYTNGTLEYTSSGGQTNLFSVTSASTTFRTSSEYGSDYSVYVQKGLDRLVISDVVRNGAGLEGHLTNY